jgi:hypothetical protein
MSISEHFQNNVVMAHKELSASKTTMRCFGEVIRSVPEDDEVTYTMNSSGHRSDEFKFEHDGLHVLFAGCSSTLGEGLPYMSNWTGRFYNKISKVTKTSGHFNLSFLGGSTELIVANIYKYIIKYGKPDVLLVHTPETLRCVSYNGKEYSNQMNLEDVEIRIKNRWYSYNAMLGLEMYCSAVGIKLLWTSWEDSDVDFYYKTHMFKNFMPYKSVDIMLFATNKHEKDSKYFKIARDNAHPGFEYSDGLANAYFKEVMYRWPELKG